MLFDNPKENGCGTQHPVSKDAAEGPSRTQFSVVGSHLENGLSAGPATLLQPANRDPCFGSLALPSQAAGRAKPDSWLPALFAPFCSGSPCGGFPRVLPFSLLHTPLSLSPSDLCELLLASPDPASSPSNCTSAAQVPAYLLTATLVANKGIDVGRVQALRLLVGRSAQKEAIAPSPPFVEKAWWVCQSRVRIIS